jgi:hypothetical protein
MCKGKIKFCSATVKIKFAYEKAQFFGLEKGMKSTPCEDKQKMFLAILCWYT